MVFFWFVFLMLFFSDTFAWPLAPLFWIFGDISSGFQSQSGFCLIRIAEANVMYMIEYVQSEFLCLFLTGHEKI